MKITIFLLIALFALSQAEPSCDLDSMCKGCDSATADKCTHCYNGVVATYGARALVSNACSTKLTAITDCDVYDDQLAAASTSTLSPNPNCWKCASGKILNSDQLAVDTANLIVTSPATTTCGTTAISTGATVSGCGTGIMGTGSGTITGQCLFSTAGVCHITNWGTAPTAASCTSTHPNCSVTRWVWTTANTNAGAAVCHIAETGYAVKSDGLSGATFTTDTNCKQLLSGDTTCGVCIDAYWFGGAKCYLSSRMLALSAAAFLLAYLF